MDGIERQPLETFGLENGDEMEPGGGDVQRRGRCRQPIELQAPRAMFGQRAIGRRLFDGLGLGGHGLQVEMREVLAGGDQQREGGQQTECCPNSS